MPDRKEDKDPSVNFPVWILGSPSPVGTQVYLVKGLVLLTLPDGGNCLPIFTDEGVAKAFLEKHGGESREYSIPKIVDRKQLDLLLQFLAERQGITQVLIGRPENRFSMPTIIEVRFNIAMQLE